MILYAHRRIEPQPILELSTILPIGHQMGYCYQVVRNLPLKTIRIQVETNDGCRTIWYEKSRLKNATEVICDRVNQQLSGLNLKRVEVSLSPTTV